MKKKYSVILRSVLFMGTLLILASCIKDDLSVCIDPRGNVRLTLSLDVNVSSKTDNSNEYQIDSAHVYVFDSEDRFVTFATGGAYTPNQDYEFFFDLEGGEHYFVVWTNPGDIYKTNYTFAQCGQNNYRSSELRYYMDISATNCLSEDIPDLLYGSHKQDIDGNWNNHVIIDMIPETYNINVKVTGLLEQEDENFEFTITDNTSYYNFDNSIIRPTDDFTYTRHANQENNELNVSFKVLRLEKDRDPRFVLTSLTKSETLYSNSLTDMIRSAYQQANQILNFNETYTFDVLLTFNIDLGVSVSVNGWKYSPQPGELK